MPAQKFGALPAIILTITSIIVTASLAWLAGARLTAPAPEEVTTDHVDTSSVAPVALTGIGIPAHQVLTALLGTDASWSAKVPAPFGCQTTAATVSASTPTISAHAYQAGMAIPALDALARCGSRTDVNGTFAVRMSAPGGTVLAWTRGDVLITLSTPTPDPTQAADLDSRLVELLRPVCDNLAPLKGDAARNPVSDTYAGWVTTRPVTVPPLPEPTPFAETQAPTPSTTPPTTPTPTVTPSLPAVTLATELPPPTPLTLPVRPEGITGPPLPNPVLTPVLPSPPSEQQTSAEITVTVPDPNGPGCGWAFTGQTAPVVDEDALETAMEARTTAATTDLLTAQQRWAVDAGAYLSAAQTYLTGREAWEAYVTQVQSVVGQWTQQRNDLTKYESAFAAYVTAVQAREKFLADQDIARRSYETALAQCTVTTPTPTPTPNPAPAPPLNVGEVTAACPKRPAIIDQTPPVVPQQPTPPALWVQP